MKCAIGKDIRWVRADIKLLALAGAAMRAMGLDKRPPKDKITWFDRAKR
jgi:hypothetical protein